MSSRAPLLLGLVLILLVLHAGLAPVAFLFLFARIRPDSVLEHPLRARLLALVQARPGLGLKELAAETRVGWGTIVHHMNRLEDSGLVASEAAGRRRAFYGAREDAATRGLGALAGRPAVQRLAGAVLRAPGVSQRDAARLASVSPALAHRLLSELEARGLVRSQRSWRSRTYHATRSLGGEEQTSTMPTLPSAENPSLSRQETHTV